ncbi:hypothetical protein TrRE_jg5178 [Triparma retinervis]|uniref:Uncharacterized protein n=1 Tax=Triparma retinervis TaxID=2557542 RepID=A0A9W7C503_9STRA|nr:hypothetical protein TrRE_jg5178 [Triparma retinervis]
MANSARTTAEQMEDVMGSLSEANVYILAGELGMAEESYASALDDAERSFGECHVTTLKCLECMARCCKMQGKMDLAIPMYERFISLRDEAEKRRIKNVFDSGSLATVYQELGDCLETSGRIEESEAMQSRAEKVLGVLKERVEQIERKEQEDGEEEEEGEEKEEEEEEEEEEDEDEDEDEDSETKENTRTNGKSWRF